MEFAIMPDEYETQYFEMKEKYDKFMKDHEVMKEKVKAIQMYSPL